MTLQVLITTLRCVPFSLNWDVNPFGRDCYVSDFQFLMGSSISHISTNVLLLGFPVPLIWRLHMPRSHRIILTVLFAMSILYVAFLFISSPRSTSKNRRQRVILKWVYSLTIDLNLV